MKKCILMAVCVCATLTLQAQGPDWANFGRYREANKTATHGSKAVFMGNSITDGWAAQRPDFFNENGYIGRGIGGQVTSQMLVRFRADVIDLEPKAVVILAGTNDIAGNNGYISVDDILGNIVSMAELARAHKIKVVLCSVLPVYQYPWSPNVDAVTLIAELNQKLRAYAEEHKIPYVDYYEAMKDERKGLPAALAGDGVHPTAEGYQIMEDMIKPVLDKLVR